METTSQDTSSPFDTFTQFQKMLLSNWGQAAENFQETWKKVEWPVGANADAREAFKHYDIWKESFGRYYATLLNASTLNTPVDTAAKLFSGADAFVKLYEFWEPLARVLQEKSLDLDSYKQFLDPVKYKELIDTVFGFSSRDTIAEFLAPLSKMADMWSSKGHGSIKLLSDVIQKNMDAYRGLAAGDPRAASKLFHSLDTAFESTLGKILTAPAVGVEREQIELLLRTVDRYKVFVAKNTELQQEIHVIAHRALEDVVKGVAHKIKQEGRVGGFGSFLDLWISVNEKAFLSLFKTEQFSKLQGTVLDAALDARRYNQLLLESYLGNFPVALRSEMDDAYKTIYDLKKRVRNLEKTNAELDELRDEIASLKKSVGAPEKRQSAAEGAGANGARASARMASGKKA